MKRKITPFQKISALTLIIALFAMTVSPAFATESLYISNSELNTYYWWSVNPTINYTTVGRTFTGNDQFLSRVSFYLKNNSVAESGTVRAVLFNDTEDGGASYKPLHNAVPVAYSTNTYDVSGLIAPTLVTFTFADTFNLTSSTIYGVALEVAGTLGTAILAASSAAGGMFYDGGAGTRDFIVHPYGAIVYIYTDDIEGGGDPYTPPGGADLTSWDTIIASFTSFIVPLLVMMLPAFLLCFITRRVDKWLLIIGITIGAGLGYYFGMVPLWLVFLVTIGLIGMAYQSVRGGGGN